MHGFFCCFQDSKIKLLAVESLKKDIGRRRYGPEKIMLQNCRKTGEVAGEDNELQKFINGGSGPEKSPNSAQMFLRSMRCSRIKLAQKEILIKEESSCQREPSQLEILEGKKFQRIKLQDYLNKIHKFKINSGRGDQIKKEGLNNLIIRNSMIFGLLNPR